MDATRRNFIGSAAALPFIAAPVLALGNNAPAGRAAWERAKAAFDAADALDKAANDRWDAVCAAAGRSMINRDELIAHGYDVDADEAAGEARYNALWHLYETPAPDLATLAEKVELMKAEQAFECERAIECLVDDVRRIAAEAVRNG